MGGGAMRVAGLVSVVIPTYNVGAVVRDSVASALGQTYGAVEVIVVDDGSTDGTMRHLDGIDDPRLRIIVKDNGGASTARNAALEAATGQYIAFLDADDVWDPDKLARTVPLLQGNVLAGTMMRYLDEDGRASGSAAGEDPNAGDAPVRIRGARLLPFPLSSMVLDADVLERVGGFDTSLRYSQDLDFFVRVAREGSLGFVPEPLGGYRLRPGAASSAHFAEQRKRMRFIQARFDARDAGGDLTWDEFEAGYRLTGRQRRLDAAARAYREGGLDLAAGRWRGAWGVAKAFALSPRYTAPRLVRHVQASRA